MVSGPQLLLPLAADLGIIHAVLAAGMQNASIKES
jgi:hypothetical protein